MKPNSSIDFASKTRNAVVVSISCAVQMKKIAFVEMIEHCFLFWFWFWFDCDRRMPMVWWNFWTNRNNRIEPAILTIYRKLTADRPFEIMNIFVPHSTWLIENSICAVIRLHSYWRTCVLILIWSFEILVFTDLLLKIKDSFVFFFKHLIKFFTFTQWIFKQLKMWTVKDFEYRPEERHS